MTIKQNKLQTILYAVITLIAAVAFFYFAIFDIRSSSQDYYFMLGNAVIYWIFRGLCIICFFFAFAADIYFLKQMFSKEPLIEICDEYFYDNSSAISLGKIDWSDMERAYIKGGFLNIKLKNPEMYFEKMSWLQRFMIKVNLKIGYGDICISPQRFKKEEEKFLDEFNRRKAISQ